MATLVERLRDIDKQALSTTKKDPVRAKQEAFEAEARTYHLIKRINRGETTFLAEYEAVFGKYDGEATKYSQGLTNNLFNRAKVLYQIIGEGEQLPGFNVNSMQLVTDESLTKLGWILGLVCGIGHTKKESRRTFLRASAETILGGAGLGFFGKVIGSTTSKIGEYHLAQLRENAIYLDQQHRQYVRKQV